MRIQGSQSKALTNMLKRKQQTLAKPDWLKIRPPTTEKYPKIKSLLKDKALNTVCVEAHCPNISKCWTPKKGAGTATFMILGDTCTRACRFCMVKSGNPEKKIDDKEPEKLAQSVKKMNLEYVVLTCVTRDDLSDGGAFHFAKCIKTLRKHHPKLLIEVLISDLNGNIKALEKIISAVPNVIGHNLETVERLQGEVRDPRANYKKSLKILEYTKRIAPKIFTKTSLMLGLGETEEEILQTMEDCRATNVDIITFGQYLQPSPFHLTVKEYVTPAKFREYKQIAEKLGFLYCASGPFVRSSYKAGELFMKNILTKNVPR